MPSSLKARKLLELAMDPHEVPLCDHCGESTGAEAEDYMPEVLDRLAKLMEQGGLDGPDSQQEV